MRALTDAHDWTSSDLGDRSTWPRSLEASLDLMLSSPLAMCIGWGPALTLFYNDAYTPFLGKRHPKAVGRPLKEVWSDVWSDIKQPIVTTLAGKAVAFEDMPLTMTRHGYPEETWWTFAYSPLRDDSGTIVGFLDIATETTKKVLNDRELVREREQLAASEAQLRALNADLEAQHSLTTRAIDIARLGTFAWHVDSGTVELNDRSRQIFGFPDAGQIEAEAVFGLIDPEALNDVVAKSRNAIVTRSRIEIDYPILRPDGMRRWIRSLGDYVESPSGEGCMTGVFLDITDEKVAEQALAAEKIELKQAVEQRTVERDRLWRNSLDLLAVAAPDGTLNAVNAAWTTLLGWEESELIAESFVRLVHPDDLEATQIAFVGILDAPLTDPFEYRLLHNDGSYRWFAWTAAFEAGRIYANGRDVTERREQAEALEASRAALAQAQKMEAVGQLTGGLAHDFNNLLTGMMGNLELLQVRLGRGKLDDLDRFISAAQGAGRRAASLTQRLLAFSRRQTLDPKPSDANRLIVGLEDMLRRTVGASADIEIVQAAGLWTTSVDVGQLENALLNLCINARDAMPEGGRITVETANKWIDDRTGRERDMPPGQYISLCVTDTGTGMSAATIERAFEPFYTTKPIGQGTGLGLSMIYGFARQSGGQVRIYSEVGSGTTVCIYLPRFHGEAENAEEVDTSALRESSSSATILVVDDEATIRHLIDEVLDDVGYTVIGAADGAAGIKVLQSGARIELLITDVGLPNGMNGRQVADEARRLRPGLKVLFITGFAENAAFGNGHLEPGMELLTKPFTLEALTAKVADILKAPAI